MDEKRHWYWDKWLYNDGEYSKDLKWARYIALKFLKKHSEKYNPEKCCVVFDLDDTIVFGDPEQAFGIREAEFGNKGKTGQGEISDGILAQSGEYS